MPRKSSRVKQLRAMFARFKRDKISSLKPTIKTRKQVGSQFDKFSTLKLAKIITQIEFKQPLRSLNLVRVTPTKSFGISGIKKLTKKQAVAAYDKGFVVDLKRKHIFLRIGNTIGERGDNKPSKPKHRTRRLRINPSLRSK